MKTTLIAALIFAAFPAMAEEYVNTDVKCAAISALAESTMTARQNGVSMSYMMDMVGESEPWLVEIARPLVIAAYEHNRYHSWKVQRQKIEDFRDEWHLTCIKVSKE